MRLLPLGLAVLALAAVAAGWFLFRPPGPPAGTAGSAPPSRSRAARDPGGAPGGPAVPSPGAPGAAPGSAPAPRAGTPRAEPPRGPDVVPPRAPGGLPEGGIGEVPRPDLPAGELEKVEAVKTRLREAAFEKVDWRDRSLRAVAADIAAKSGVPVEIRGEGLADEPVTCRFERQDGLGLLMEVTIRRNLRFEVTAEKVIVSR